jgi:hypothetical protein
VRRWGHRRAMADPETRGDAGRTLGASWQCNVAMMMGVMSGEIAVRTGQFFLLLEPNRLVIDRTEEIKYRRFFIYLAWVVICGFVFHGHRRWGLVDCMFPCLYYSFRRSKTWND